MPVSQIRTIQDEIYYEYAKLMSRSAFDGGVNGDFVMDRFQALKAGYINMSEVIREWQGEREEAGRCVFCGTEDDLQTGTLIPRSHGGLNSPGNSVLACKACNSARNNRGIFEWLGQKKKVQAHRLAVGKYIQGLYELHQSKGTLSMDVQNLHRLCEDCRHFKACTDKNKTGEMTRLCLESVL